MSKHLKPLRCAAGIVAALVGTAVAMVSLLRFLPPPTSAFMLASKHKPVHYQWVAWQHIAPTAALAVVASEDQKFQSHWGFDFDAMESALQHNAHSRHIHGASTISQQTAKNLFLWSGRSYLRKGLEAGFTVLLEALWPKQRILEVYLNVAQFGPGIYGVEAASERYFGQPAARLSRHQAALLAAVLPDPEHLHADHPSAYVSARASDIEEQMQLLGSGYLRQLD